MYGYYLRSQNVTLGNGTEGSAWDAHYSCFKGSSELCTAASFPDKVYEDNWVTRNGLEMLEKWRNENQGQQPFFLQINFPGPHPPFIVTSTMAEKTVSQSESVEKPNPRQSL